VLQVRLGGSRTSAAAEPAALLVAPRRGRTSMLVSGGIAATVLALVITRPPQVEAAVVGFLAWCGIG
jgi:hypothetical protein